MESQWSRHRRCFNACTLLPWRFGRFVLQSRLSARVDVDEQEAQRYNANTAVECITSAVADENAAPGISVSDQNSFSNKASSEYHDVDHTPSLNYG